MDDEGHHRGRGRRPQPAAVPSQLPARLIDVLDRGLAHGLDRLGVGRSQRGAGLLGQVAHRAQRQRHVEDVFGQLLQAALAEVVAAGQVGQGGGQARADAVGLEVGRDGGVVEGAAAGAGAEVPAILGDFRRQPGQFGHLVPGRLRVVGCRPGRQGLVAALAVAGDEVVRVQ